MSNEIGQASTTALPCALRPSFRYGHGTQALAPTFDDEIQLKFLHWIECTRTASSESFPEISVKEKLMCPLIWCRTSFKDLSSTLEHVPACPFLLDACYWCPYCGRPERFKEREPTSFGRMQQDEPDKETSYRRAVAFFKRFGYQGNGYPDRSSPSIPRVSIEQSGNKMHYPDLGRKLHDNPRPVGFGGSKLYVLDDKVQCATPASDSSRLSVNSDPTTTTPQLQELTRSAGLQSFPPWSVISDRFVASVDADDYHNSNNAIVPGNKTHVSPIQVSATLSRTGACVPSLQIPQSDAPTLHSSIKMYTKPSFDGPQPSIRNKKGIDTPSMATFHGSENLYHEENISSHAYIADLCDGMRAMGEEWIRRLALGAKVPQLDSQFYARALFQLGIGALSNNLRGATPSSFQDVFAMTHVVITSSSIVREDDDERSWNLILEGACQWKNLISDTTEREIFVRVMRRLCHPSRSTDLSAIHDSTMGNVFLPAEQTTLASLIHSLSSTPGDSRIHEEVDNNCEVFTIDNKQTRLPRVSQANVAMEAFTDFLDDFAHAVIVEDLADRRTYASQYIQQHISGIETLDRNIVGRLYKWEGLEAFRGVVTEIQNMLRCGLLHTVRDVEVMLSWSGKSHSRSPRLLQKYLKLVKHLCDEVMKESGLHWRDSFYETILGTVIATASELHHSRGHAFQTPPVTPFDDLSLSQSIVKSTTNAASPLAGLDTSKVSSSDPVEPSSAPSEDISHCPDPTCKASFKGASQKSNLNRHLKSVLHHKQDSLFKCEFCKSAFGRSDNLQQHIRKNHGVDPVWQDFGADTFFK